MPELIASAARTKETKEMEFKNFVPSRKFDDSELYKIVNSDLTRSNIYLKLELPSTKFKKGVFEIRTLGKGSDLTESDGWTGNSLNAFGKEFGVTVQGDMIKSKDKLRLHFDYNDQGRLDSLRVDKFVGNSWREVENYKTEEIPSAGVQISKIEPRETGVSGISKKAQKSEFVE